MLTIEGLEIFSPKLFLNGDVTLLGMLACGLRSLRTEAEVLWKKSKGSLLSWC